MSLGNNIRYLRGNKKITQESLANIMNVSRQTIFRWEADEVIPELERLIELSKVFSCTLDELVLADLESYSKIYSDIVIKRVPACKVARYVIISTNPEDDANNYMISWGKKSGLLSYYPDAMLIGYDFPFVSVEQQNRFNMRGYASAYFLPDTFETDCLGVEYIAQEEAEYAVITITDPFVQAFERIPKAYKYILEYFEKNNCKEKHRENVLDCFEHVYENDGITYMDVYMCKL